MYYHQASEYCTYSTILKQRGILVNPKVLKCMFQTSSAYSSSTRGARMSMNVNGIASGVESENTCSGMIR